MRIHAETKALLLDRVSQMLDNPTCHVEMRIGTREVQSATSEWLEHVATGGAVLVIRVGTGDTNFDRLGRVLGPHSNESLHLEKRR